MKTLKLLLSLALFGITCAVASETTPLSLVNPLMGTRNPNGLSQGHHNPSGRPPLSDERLDPFHQ
jgi:hypothetical protein